MDRSSVLGSLVALLIGLALGAAALSWWEGGRQSTEIESLKVRLADERGVGPGQGQAAERRAQRREAAARGARAGRGAAEERQAAVAPLVR